MSEQRYTPETAAQRSPEQADKIHEMALALLAKKGITAENATYDQYADAATIAAEVVASGKTKTADMLAVAALGADASEPLDKTTTTVLARFAKDGRFVRNLDVTEEEFLQAAIAAEQEREAENGVVAPSKLRDPVERERHERTIAAEAADSSFSADGAYGVDGYCRTCGYALDSGLCRC